MTNNIFKQYPYFLNSNGFYEVIPPKSNNDVEKIIQLSSPIIIENKFLDPSTGVEKLVITDGKNIERIEASDILTSFKLPGLTNHKISKSIIQLYGMLQIQLQLLQNLTFNSPIIIILKYR